MREDSTKGLSNVIRNGPLVRQVREPVVHENGGQEIVLRIDAKSSMGKAMTYPLPSREAC